MPLLARRARIAIPLPPRSGSSRERRRHRPGEPAERIPGSAPQRRAPGRPALRGELGGEFIAAGTGESVRRRDQRRVLPSSDPGRLRFPEVRIGAVAAVRPGGAGGGVEDF